MLLLTLLGFNFNFTNINLLFFRFDTLYILLILHFESEAEISK